MSRIGKLPVTVPAGVKVDIQNNVICVEGPKGKLCQDYTANVKVELNDGVISVVSNIAPTEVTNLVQSALNDDMSKARELHYKLLPFFKAAFVDGNPSSIKYAMSTKGIIKPCVRLPLVEVKESAKSVIENALKECNL